VLPGPMQSFEGLDVCRVSLLQ